MRNPMAQYTTKTLTRDGITYTADFRETDGGFRVTSFTLSVAGQKIDLLRDAPSHWTEEARDAWLIKTHPQLSMLADEVYHQGAETRYEVAA